MVLAAQVKQAVTEHVTNTCIMPNCGMKKSKQDTVMDSNKREESRRPLGGKTKPRAEG